MRSITLLLFAVILCLTVIGCGQPAEQTTPPDQVTPKTVAQPPAVKAQPGSPVILEAWVMAECPFGTGAENAIHKAKEVLGDKLQVRIRFVLNEKPDGKGLTSLHGDKEVALDGMQACVGILWPEKQLPFIATFNNASTPWQQTAAEFGLDVAAIEACLKDGRGENLLLNDARESKGRNINSSPTLFFNGTEYKGARGSLDIFEAACKLFPQGQAPAVCADPPKELSRTDNEAAGNCGGSNLPPVPDELKAELEFTHTIIYDPRAFTSNVDEVTAQTKQYFPNAKINKVDADSAEGKKLIQEYKIEWLPVYLFPRKITEAKNFNQFRQVLTKTDDGAYYYLDPKQVGANINLSRKKIPGEVRIYYSPYAPQALTMLLEIRDLLSMPEFSKYAKSIRIIPRAEMDQSGQMQARGGIGEIEELGRHLAIRSMSPESFYKYVEARRESPLSSYWEDFVAKAGLDPQKVKAMATSNDVMNQLIANSKEADEVHAGPTFAVLVENRELADVTSKQDFLKILQGMKKGQ